MRSLEAFGTLPEPTFDRIVALVADLFDAPTAFVSLIERDRAWLKARVGFDRVDLPRSDLLCGTMVADAGAAPCVVLDAARDARFSDHPLVTGPPHVRFYVGAPLMTAGGAVLGMLCAMDAVVRPAPSERQLGRLTALAGLVTDELDLRRSQRTSREAERLLSLAASVAGIGHWRLDLKTFALTWSDEVYRIYGEARAAFRPTVAAALAFCHPDDRDDVADVIRRAGLDGSSFGYRRRIRRADGSERLVVSKGVCEFGPDGAVTALFGVTQDVTEQAATEAALRDSEARHRLLAEQVTDIILHVGLDGRITYASPSAAAMVGRSSATLVGESALALVDPGDRRGLLRRFLRLRAGTAPSQDGAVAYRALRPDGGLQWLESHPTPAFDGDGAPTGWIDVIRDVSARKRQDAEFAEARRAADAAAGAKSELLANMSHELRTPLNGIIGFTQILKRDQGLGGDRLRLVERIEDAGQSLLDIVNDVLELSKLESGAVKLRTRPFSLARLVEDAVALVRPDAERKGLDLALDLPASPLGLMLGDPDRLRQVVLNLLSNAVKFTTFGTVRLGVSADAVRPDGYAGDPGAAPVLAVSIVVADSGIGIAADSIPKLFRRFEQVDGSVSRRFGGTGLGLAISKKLLEAMHGTIAVESSVGAGSRFSVSLHLPQAAERRIANPEVERSVQHAGRAQARDALKGRAILLAEDIPMNQKLAVLMLAPLGAEIDVVPDGTEAVEAVRRRRYDLVLMDVEMPGLGGLEAAQRIRALEGPGASLPIVALTANVYPEQIALCREAGMDDHLAKPFGPDELTAMALKWARRLVVADPDPLQTPSG